MDTNCKSHLPKGFFHLQPVVERGEELMRGVLSDFIFFPLIGEDTLHINEHAVLLTVFLLWVS